MAMIRLAHGGLVLLLASVLGCSGGDDTTPEEGQGGGGGGGGQGAVSFAAQIHPIFLAKCAGSGCHSEANPYQPGHAAEDVNEAYAAATGVTASGDLVYERILVRASGSDARGIMPPTYAPPTAAAPVPCEGALGQPGCLTQAEFDLVQDWVDQGRPE
ncbi:MAG TPA: hypothetical protein VJU61_07095 [Polyangiaceae bacterium]|nr:hypothetical protein [Polyangiaceae bacterium]